MNDAEKLADLQNHWGSAYRIWRGIGNSWCARYRDAPRDEPLVAYRDDNLRELIRHDYHVRTVPTTIGAAGRVLYPLGSVVQQDDQ